ncbi:MAG: hypothetical protein AB7P33_03315 [Dehalococcoidia bacterium]
MRILSLGCPLPDSLIDNYDWASALSFYDYDALIVDPMVAVSQFVEGIVNSGESFATYNNEPVLDGPTTADAVGLADLLRRRRVETERFLAGGGLIVVMAYPDVPHPRVSGFTGAHRYYWLPAPEGTDYGSKFLQPAGGKHVAPTDFEHPFADYLESMRDSVVYRASITDGAFGSAAKVIGRSPGGAALAVELKVGNGRVIFLPAYPTNLTHGERGGIARSLVNAIRNAILTDAEDDPPHWINQYSVPGLAEAEQALEAAEDRMDEVEAELIEARNAFRKLDHYRRLLWQEGKYGLDLPVRDVLGELGFSAISAVDEPPVFMFNGDTVFVEIEGSVNSVGMNPHYRLRQRLEERIAEGRRVHGIVIVNGERAQPPTERPQPIEDSLRIASESMRYCVVETADVFDALIEKMKGEGDSAAFCRALMETEGFYRKPAPAVTESTTADSTESK